MSVIVAVPAAIASTVPSSTVAMSGLSETHSTAVKYASAGKTSVILISSTSPTSSSIVWWLNVIELTCGSTGGFSVIVTSVCFETPSSVNVIVAVPEDNASTVPSVATVATVSSLLSHVVVEGIAPLGVTSLYVSETLSPVSRLSCGTSVKSSTCSVSCSGSLTVTVVCFETPSSVNVIVAVPEDNASTVPSVATVATVSSLLSHVVVEGVAPSGDTTLYVNVCVSPTSSCTLSINVNSSTSGFGCTTMLYFFTSVPYVANTVVSPCETPVTTPSSTDAILRSLDSQTMSREVSGLGSVIVSSTTTLYVNNVPPLSPVPPPLSPSLSPS